MDPIEIIRLLADTPLPTLLVVIGFVMLSVGFGLKVRAVIDVDSINRTYAKIIGYILLLVGLVLYIMNIVPETGPQPESATDPFFLYYLVSVPVIVFFYWITLKLTNGKMQIRTMKLSFIFIGTLLTFAVLWRAMDVYLYVNSEATRSVPVGLDHAPNYLPYFALLGPAIAAIVWAIYAHTREKENRENRLPMLSYFFISCMYLTVCRLAWELIDYLAEKQIS